MAASESARPLPPVNPPPRGDAPVAAKQITASDVPESGMRSLSSALGLPGGDARPHDVIDAQISDLERWAQGNARRVKAHRIRFWALRGIAFLGAAGAAAAAVYGFAQVAVVAGAVAALCVAVDSAWPGAWPGNLELRALHDLRELQNSVRLRWEKVCLAHPDPIASARTANALALLDHIQEKREEIGRYLSDSEASPTAAKD